MNDPVQTMTQVLGILYEAVTLLSTVDGMESGVADIDAVANNLMEEIEELKSLAPKNVVHLDPLKSLTVASLIAILNKSGYSDADFDEAEFVNINTVGDYVYNVSYVDEFDGCEMTAGIYVTRNPKTFEVTAEF